MSHGKNRTKLLDHSAGLVEGFAGGPSWNFLYEASTVKHPDYNLGDRVCLPDGRSFRYAKAGNTLNADHGAKYWNEELVKYATNVVAAQVAGDSEIQVTVAATDGADADGAIAADELRGGYIVIYSNSLSTQQRGIVGNTAIAASGGTITVYLDADLHVAVSTTTSFVEILGNPYENVYSTNNGYSSVAGVPLVEATVGEYVWLQTWGPLWLAPGAAGVGGGAEERECVFGGNGALFEHNVGDTSDQRQHAGHIINKDSAAGDGPPFIMLQICP